MRPSHTQMPAGSGLKRILLTVAAVALLFIASGPVLAGLQGIDLPATGKPEQTLSGIAVGIHAAGMSLDQFIDLFGPPTSKEDSVVPDGAGGTRFYKWDWPGMRMSVATQFFYRDDTHKSISQSGVDYVDVWSDSPRGELGTTGRGFEIGSTLERQEALYGDHYSIPYTEKDGTQHVSVKWEDGTELTIDYGPSGHSNHIRLASGNQ